MRTVLTILVVVVLGGAAVPPPPEQADWLLEPASFRASLATTRTGLRLSNGLVSRDFVLEPNFGTVDLFSHEAGGVIVPLNLHNTHNILVPISATTRRTISPPDQADSSLLRALSPEAELRLVTGAGAGLRVAVGGVTADTHRQHSYRAQ